MLLYFIILFYFLFVIVHLHIRSHVNGLVLTQSGDCWIIHRFQALVGHVTLCYTQLAVLGFHFNFHYMLKIAGLYSQMSNL